MALVLSLALGEDFFIGNMRFEVCDIEAASRFRLHHKKDVTAGNLKISEPVVTDITDAKSVEIMPDVFVSAGRGARQMIQVAIEAPRDIPIIRGDRKRALAKTHEPLVHA